MYELLFQTDGLIIPAGYVLTGSLVLLAAVLLRGFWLKTALALGGLWLLYGAYAFAYTPMGIPPWNTTWGWWSTHSLPFWLPLLVVVGPALWRVTNAAVDGFDRLLERYVPMPGGDES